MKTHQDSHNTERATQRTSCELIVNHGVCIKLVKNNLVRLQVPIPEEMLPVFSSASKSFPTRAPFLLRLHDMKIVLESFWEQDSTRLGKQAQAIHQPITSAPDLAPFCNLKPLLVLLNKDMELFRILLNEHYTDDKLNQEVLDKIAARAVDRLRTGGESVQDVFSVAEFRSREEMKKRIVRSILDMWSQFKTGNPISCAFQAILYNLQAFGRRCYVCGASHETEEDCKDATTCCNSLCR